MSDPIWVSDFGTEEKNPFMKIFRLEFTFFSMAESTAKIV
jgi:hypothetical protein